MCKRRLRFTSIVHVATKRAISLVIVGILAMGPVVSSMAAEESATDEGTAEKSRAARTEQDSDITKTESKREKAEDDDEAAEEEIISVEEANETMALYDDEDAQWEEVYIDSVEDLKAFSRNCWLDTWSVNKKVYLMQDLDLTDSDFVSIPTFGGYFNGQGHTVSGLVVRDSLSYTGLFCYTQESAVVANLKVRGNVRPSGKSMVVGGVVGDNSGIIINCAFEGNVEGNDYVGGITGFNEQSGILIDCISSGKITGAHYTGGIVGENTGNIAGCVNEADVNVSNEDKAMSLEDFNLEQYAAGLLDVEDSDGKSNKASAINNTIDSGGIAGLSTGIIQYCSNSGTIGYEHVGYNMGGIVGRQSGYVYSCENTGTVYGRKDVGGIAGQTEPYIAVDLTEDIAYQLSENIDELHDLAGRMLNDAGRESDTVSARLTVIQDFIDKALDDTHFLADRTIEWTDGMIGSANDVVGRLDYIMDEAGRSGGFIDQSRNAAGNVKNAAVELGNTVEALDIYRYMTPEEQQRYDSAKSFLQSASEQYTKDYAKVVEAYQNYYIDQIRSTNSDYMRTVSGSDGGSASGDETNGTGGSDISGNTSNLDSDSNMNPGAGSGADVGTGSGNINGIGADTSAGEGNNSDSSGNINDGGQSGSTGSGSGQGTDTDEVIGSDTGSDSGTGTDTGSGSNSGMDTMPGSGSDSSMGTETGSGSNSGVDAMPGLNLNPESNTEINLNREADNTSDSSFKLYVETGMNSDDNSDLALYSDQMAGAASEKDLKPRINGNVDTGWQWNGANTYKTYLDKNVTGWVHYHADGSTTDFPQTDGEQGELDRRLLKDVSDAMKNASIDIKKDAAKYANDKYMESHPGSLGYEEDMKDNLTTMADIALKTSESMSDEVRSKLQSAVEYARSATENLESAGSEVKNIFNTVNGMEDILLPQLGGDYRSRAGSLNTNLQGLSDNMGQLNDEMSSTNDVMLADLSDINDQFSKIMRLYTDAIDGVLDMDYSTVYEDNSQEDAENSTDATIADCRNSGTVRGDLNVSGIAGTMAIEYDFDLEGDVTGIDNARWNSTFLTKCILRHNINEGNITAQKSYAGGISGLQEMGTILRCENYGRINSTSGNYVGGIAGQSLSYITNGYSKCTVSGEEYVAGIAGYGSSMENCCAMVRIQDAVSFAGAIAGETDSGGTVTGNYFVSDEIAGIDRISYSGKAEPVSYEQLLEIEGLPNRFRMMSVTFYADDEEVKLVTCPFGGNVLREVYPDIPVKDGFYADWDIREIRNIMYDEDVTAEYVRYLTTLASDQTRENGQSVLLADGMFKQEAVLEVAGGSVGGNDDSNVPSLKNLTEYWQITVPEDGNEQHQLRYQAPQGQTEGIEIYVKQDGEWLQANTELMGIYHLFTIEGTKAEIAVCIQDQDIVVYLLCMVSAVIVVFVVIFIIRRKKKRGPKKVA